MGAASSKAGTGIALHQSMNRIWIELLTKATLCAVVLGLVAGVTAFLLF